MTNNKNKTAAGFILTLLSGILWGFSGSCGQYIFANCGATSRWLVPVRLFIAGIILLSVCAVKNKSKVFAVWKGKKNITSMLLFSVFGLVMCQFSYFRAIELSNAGIATVLQYLAPAMILVFMCLKNKKLPVLSEAVSIILATGGTFLIATGGSLSSFAVSGEALFWGIVAAIFLVCYTLLPIPLFKVSDTPTVLGWGLTVGGIGLAFVFNPFESAPQISAKLILSVAAIVILGTVIAYTFYLEGVRLIGATKTSIVSSIEPVSATVISALWLGSDFSLTDIIGMAMIISTIFIIGFSSKKKTE